MRTQKLKLIFCLVIATWILSGSLYAQEGTYHIKGILKDSLTHQPGEFFSIGLKKDSTTLKVVTSDEQGKFTIDKVSPGKYLLMIAAIGYQRREIQVTINGHKDLGELLVTTAIGQLNEVSIVTSRPLIKQEADRISYDVQADPESKVMTVLDMMRKIPLLSVDADENIKLKGNGNYKILINGKPSGMVARDPKEVLRNMPATNVQKIEVITTPPSRYESEGLAGLINIITAKKATNGYNGNINSRQQFPGGPGINANLTFKQGDFGASIYSGTGIWEVNGLSNSEKRYSPGTANSTMLSNGQTRINNRWAWGGAELSYEVDSLNLLTAEINPYGGFNHQFQNQQFDITEAQQWSTYGMDGQTRYEWGGWEASFNYQKGFKKKKEHLMTLSYKFSDDSNPQINKVNFLKQQNYSGIDFTQNNNSISKEHTAQIDYVNPFKRITVEAGVKGILRSGKSYFSTYQLLTEGGELIFDPTQSNRYNNQQTIFGAYNAYTLNLDSTMTLKAGARLEATDVEGIFLSTQSKVNSNYLNLIPSVSFNKKFKNNQSFSVGYTQRLQRPAIYDLNPFVDKSRPNFEFSGNPDLKAVLSHNFELTYGNFNKGSLNVSLSYNYANGTQQRIFHFDESDQITKGTVANVGQNDLLGTNISYNLSITPKWTVNANANLNYIWLKGTINGTMAKNEGLTGYAGLNSQYKFENTWKAGISMNYGAPDVMLQGQTNDYFFVNFSGSKDLIKDKLTLSGMLANPFSRYRTFRVTTEGANFIHERVRQNFYRRVNVSLNWKFGKLTDGIKKNERSISNDDSSKKSSN